MHYLADGAEVKLGMRVVDYDRKHGVIVDDSEEMYPRNTEALLEDHSGGLKTCEAWFRVARDDGSTTSMDCSRMIAEGGKLDRDG
jgi:hypothetical protein